MLSSERIKKISLITSLALGITACSSKPDVTEFPKSANAKEEITNLEVAIENSKVAEANLLSPNSFNEARDSLEKAKVMEKENKSKEKVLKEIALGHAYLEQSQKILEANKIKIQDILAARQAAITARANKLFPKDFSKTDKRLKEEMASLEKDKDYKIQDKRSEFITSYLDLELSSIKKKYLGESKFLIDEAISNGARDLTPKTLASTNQKLQEADLFITQNRYDENNIQALSAEVLRQARQLESTMATARGLTASTTEEIALRMKKEETQLNKTQHALLEEQEVNMALAASNKEMSKEQQLNTIYEEARAKFTPEEAEVYKQGSNLVIRLRSLEFPKSQAFIRGENFVVLKKVEDVIQSFNNSSVVVEGHTDSTGGRILNQKLSEKRAEAVRQYLEANSTNKDVQFQAKGFGYEKPLSSNKTVEGRAQNRRVDVIIEPIQF
jgi:outer membrane protein OmpA-like peptidoglycan-associated protein